MKPTMKTNRVDTWRRAVGLGLVLGTLAAAGMLRAQGGPPAHAGQGAGRGAVAAATAGAEDVAALERFLSMSDAELAALQKAIARVQAMSAEEKATIRARLRTYCEASDEQRAQWRRGGFSEKEHACWAAHMHALAPEARAELQAKLHALPAEQRTEQRRAWLQTWMVEDTAQKAAGDGK